MTARKRARSNTQETGKPDTPPLTQTTSEQQTEDEVSPETLHGDEEQDHASTERETVMEEEQTQSTTDVVTAYVKAQLKERRISKETSLSTEGISRMLQYDNPEQAIFNLFRLPQNVHWGKSKTNNRFLYVAHFEKPVVVWLVGTLASVYFALDASSHSVKICPLTPPSLTSRTVVEIFRKLTHPTCQNPVDDAESIRASCPSESGASDRIFDARKGYFSSGMTTFPPSSLHVGDLVMVECNISRYLSQQSVPNAGPSRTAGRASSASPTKKGRLEDSFIPSLKMLSINLLADGPADEDNKPRNAGVSFV